MPPSKPGLAGPIGAADFQAFIDQVIAAIAEKPDVSLLVPQAKVPAVLGISRSAFFRAKGTLGFPRAVSVPGSGPHYRRSDLARWVESLKGRR